MHLLLLDASGFAHRAFHSGNKGQFRSDGLPTWAITGYLQMVWSLLGRAQADKPTHGAAIFDAPGKTFRHKRYPDYKGHRDPAKRKELNPQIPFMKHASNALGFEAVEADGFEADDVIAALCARAKAAGIRTTICSSDKDFLQLVEDNVVEVVEPVAREKKQPDGTMKFVRQRFLVADVLEKFGVPPALVPDVQALWGDDADNIPGLDGIGGKGAGKLIAQFGSLEALLDAACQSGRVVGTPSIRKVLRKEADNARLWKELATLRTDVPLDIDFDKLRLHPVEKDHLKEMLRVLECSHKYDVMFTTDLSTTIKMPKVAVPLAWWEKACRIPPGMKYQDEPQSGFYKTKLVKGGHWVPARIWRETEKDFETDKPTGFDVVHCEVDGKRRNPLQQWDGLARYPIPQKEYDYLVKNAAWSKQYDPNSSAANPSRPINWLTEPLE